MINQLQRRQKHLEATWVWKNLADGATFESIDEAAAMIAFDE